jgi:hypothetical protein
LDGLDGPSSDEKPAGRRSKKAKRNEDSDFEVRCKMRSRLGWCNHCMLAQNAGGKALGVFLGRDGVVLGSILAAL